MLKLGLFDGRPGVNATPDKSTQDTTTITSMPVRSNLYPYYAHLTGNVTIRGVSLLEVLREFGGDESWMSPGVSTATITGTLNHPNEAFLALNGIPYTLVTTKNASTGLYSVTMDIDHYLYSSSEELLRKHRIKDLIVVRVKIPIIYMVWKNETYVD